MRQDLVARATQRPPGPGPRWRGVKLRTGEGEDRRHQAVGRDRLSPLPHVGEIARVERKRAAPGLPDAVAVAEARERPLVPVLDDVDPRVPESLAIERLEIGGNADGVGTRRRLPPEPQIFDAERVEPLGPLARRLRCGGLRDRGFAAGFGEVTRRRGTLQRGGRDRRAQRRVVVLVRVALRLAAKGVHEERAIERNRPLLPGRRGGGTRGRGHLGIDRELQPAIRGRRRLRLQHDEVGRRRILRFVPVGREAQRHRRRRGDHCGGGGHLGVEAGRAVGADTRTRGRAQRRALPGVHLVSRGDVGQGIRGPNRLVEAERQNRRLIEASAEAVPVDCEEPHGRCCERERVRARERPAAHRGRRRRHRHVIPRRGRHRLPGIGREDEQGGTRPAEGAGDCGPDRDKRRRHLVGQASDRHHRL